jgi:hypothetical protein
MCGAIKRTLKNKARLEIRRKFYKVMAVSVGLYGSEKWVLTQKDKDSIQAAEMRFFISMLGATI